MRIRTLLLGLGAIVYSGLFGELFLRALKPQPLVPRYVTGSADGVRANMPDVAFRQWTPEVDVTVRYNAAGMRDDRPPPPLAKPPGECRIALLGDSYFVGFESAWPTSFAARLEAELAAAGVKARVLNFAVSGFGTAENLVVMQRRVPQWRPDVVVMSWHATDPADNLRSGLFRLNGDTLQPTGQPFLPGIELSDRLMAWPGYRWLIENSHLYSAVRERAGQIIKGLLVAVRGAEAGADSGPEGFVVVPPAPSLPSLAPPRGAGQGDARLDRALITAVEGAAAQAGARLLLFDIPTRRSRTDFLSPIALMLGEAPVPAVSPQSAFSAVARPDLKLYWEQGHLHWTPQGNAIAARVAARDILSRGWLAACMGPGAGRSASGHEAIEAGAISP
jgi:hypothetical protein